MGGRASKLPSVSVYASASRRLLTEPPPRREKVLMFEESLLAAAGTLIVLECMCIVCFLTCVFPLSYPLRRSCV